LVTPVSTLFDEVSVRLKQSPLEFWNKKLWVELGLMVRLPLASMASVSCDWT
jgi:hypothetical protein